MILIKNAKIYTMAGSILIGEDILIENGKIKKLGKDISKKDVQEVIDVKGRMVTPGFVEAHSHLGMKEDSIGQEGMDHNERVDPITPNMSVIDGLNPMDKTLKEAYEAGVTTAHVAPGSANVIGGTSIVIKTYGKRVDDMVIKNPAAMKVAFGENPKRVYSTQGKTPATRMGIAAIMRKTLAETKHYMKKKDLGEIIYDAKLESMIPVIKKEIPLKAHGHRADDTFTAIRIAKEFDVDLTLDHCTDGSVVAKELAKEGYPAIVGPSFGHRTKFELESKSFKTVKDLKSVGMKVAITTDSPVIPLNYLPLCAGLAYKEGLSEIEALESITIIPAEISGVSNRVGSLEVGKDADIVIFDGNPITDVDHKVYMTMIDGKIVFRNNN